MPSRRSHTKSHHGCRQCKARRVKCDETSPQCQRCVKRQIPCSFLENGSEGFPTPPGNTSIHDTSTPKSLDHQHSDPEKTRHAAQSTPQASSPLATDKDSANADKRFDLLDLELIQHYSTRTYMTMSSRLATHAVWRDTVFAEALRHDYLLHGLMATSALHKATLLLKSSDAYAEYSKVALAHQNAALAGFIPAVSKPNQDNGIALFSVSLLLTIWAFASKKLPEGLNRVKLNFGTGESSPGITLPMDSPTADFIEIIMILRGIYAVIRETDTWLQGDIEELLRYPRTEDLPPHSPEVEETFATLRKALEDPQLSSLWEGEDPQRMRNLFLEQMEQLRDISRCRSVVEWDGHIFSWLIMAPPPFIHCLKQSNPMALAIFAHWAAMFRCMDHHWWANGWGYSLVVDVSSLLDIVWARYLDWPRRQVGLVFQGGGAFDARRMT
ncbi:uncharacterized protein PV07_04278 [Cladophialophora immunda]|uniref:Zn(2)-C6 fungal-type domain-containing protein n=1 Tax=Cladophialophora immunda TaxID=569365 RepID=A0A0D2DAM0_9EURO|nr:uncharacterized protein PV07_04278 [Cladophialophora immunda]KIW32754.1 hypothetical protein PV07_04278 [Cladophialophora immunda]OQU95320.1 Fungal Zn2-Cys6 binuclear cluster domain-containing protein [Cladophialophora immunda]